MIRKPKEQIVISFSGGETSAYMINYLLLNYPKHKYKFIFMNTGEERQETLDFIHQCEKYFKIDVVWLEYETNYEENKPSFKVVSYETAYKSDCEFERNNGYKNHPFRKVIERYGIPAIKTPLCSEQLKGAVLLRYMRSEGFEPKDWTLALGIRADEIDRVGKYFYPLAIGGITKPIVNAFWEKMTFRLQLKGYQGNCKTCWKKSHRKLATIYKENPQHYDFFAKMEEDFSYKPLHRIDKKTKELKIIEPPFLFFRGNKTVSDIAEMSKQEFEPPHDDSRNTNYQTSLLLDGTELDVSNGCIESCEPF